MSSFTALKIPAVIVVTCQHPRKLQQHVDIVLALLSLGSETEHNFHWTSSDVSGYSAQSVYVCGRCNKTFLYSQSLSRHKWKCERLRVMNCPLCGKEFFRADKLKDHLIHH